MGRSGDGPYELSYTHFTIDKTKCHDEFINVNSWHFAQGGVHNLVESLV